jgi:hypothetical protein
VLQLDLPGLGTYDFRVRASLPDCLTRVVRASRLKLAASAVAVLVIAGCAPQPPQDPQLAIDLRWIQNYPKERRRDVDTGLYWALSFLGAKLPASGNVLSWHDRVVTLDLGAAQVQPGSQDAWKALLRSFKASEEYRKMGAIDIGRFVFVSLCSANHYYALAGTRASFNDFLARHALQPREIAVVESAVAHGNRLIDVGGGDGIDGIAFAAFEGTGKLADGSFRKQEIETLEFMDNGQLRFGLYDLDGHPRTNTSPVLTTAGKPSKCLWCHEINLNAPFNGVTNVPGYHTMAEFRALVTSDMQVVARFRSALRSKVDFRKTQDHSYAENLYLSFAHPTAARLAAEWNVPLATVQQMLRLRHLQPHAHSAYVDDGILGDQLYERSDVEALAPYTGIRGPSDAREASNFEPE